MTVIAVTSLKGGVGKTTGSVYLATIAATRSIPTLLVDANPDGSAASWIEAATGEGWISALPVVDAPSERLLVRTLAPASGPDEVIVVDTPPNNEALTRLAIVHADAVVIATKAGGIEVDRVVATLRLIPEGKRHGIVICAAPTRSNVLAMTVEGWREVGTPIWGIVPHRVGISAAMTAPLHRTGLVAYGGVLDTALNLQEATR